MKTTVEPFIPEDYAEAVAGGWCLGDPVALGQRWASRGPAFTGRIDGALAACAGLARHELLPGVYEAWAVVTALGRAHPLFVHREVVRGLRHLLDVLQPRRVQAFTDARLSVNGAWTAALGFEPEGTLRRVGPQGEDFILWARLP